MANEKLFYVGVKALITNDAGKVVLFRAETSRHQLQTEPYWDIPGGRMEQGETITETLRREVKEETGLTKLQSIHFWTSVISKHEIPLDDGTLAGLVLMVYKVIIPGGSAIKMSTEHTEYNWFTPVEAAKLLTNKYPPEFTDLLK